MRTSALRALALAAVSVVGVSAAQAEQVYGLTSTGGLVSFDSATPGTVSTIGTITGLTASHAVRAIDFRPATGQLYALSSLVGTSSVAQLYTVDLGTAAATPLPNALTLAGNNNSAISIDFNPTVDRIRIISAATGVSPVNNNFRANPNDGLIVAPGNDTGLAYAAGDPNVAGNPPAAIGAAYTNNFAGATSTTLYTWDFNNDVLSTIGGVGGPPSPNTGQMFTVATPSAFITNDTALGFDISGATGTAYLSYADFNDASERFASVNLTTGALTQLGVSGANLSDISVVVPEPATFGVLGLAAMGLLRRRK